MEKLVAHNEPHTDEREWERERKLRSEWSSVMMLCAANKSENKNAKQNERKPLKSQSTQTINGALLLYEVRCSLLWSVYFALHFEMFERTDSRM